MQKFKNYTQKKICQKKKTEKQAKMLESPMQWAPESLASTEIQERHLTKPLEATTGEQAPLVLCMRCSDDLIGMHGEAYISRSLCSQYHMSSLRRRWAGFKAKEHTLNCEQAPAGRTELSQSEIQGVFFKHVCQA